jgi:hypothetical protein
MAFQPARSAIVGYAESKKSPSSSNPSSLYLFRYSSVFTMQQEQRRHAAMKLSTTYVDFLECLTRNTSLAEVTETFEQIPATLHSLKTSGVLDIHLATQAYAYANNFSVIGTSVIDMDRATSSTLDELSDTFSRLLGSDMGEHRKCVPLQHAESR